MSKHRLGLLARTVSVFLCLALVVASIPSCGGSAPTGNGATTPPTVVTVDDNSAYARSESGNVMGATVVSGGAAYDGGFSVEVTARDEGEMGVLMVGPRESLANIDLTGVTVVLKRPGGEEIGRLENGAITYAADATKLPQPAAEVTTGLDGFLTDTIGIDPAADGETNLAKLIEYWTNPEGEAPSDVVENGLTDYVDTLRAAENAVGEDDAEPARPFLFIHNPEVGTWQVEVTSPGATVDYGIVGLYTQTRSYVADALALESSLPNLASAAARVGKDDPACQEVLNSAAVDLLSFLPLELAGAANPGLPGFVSWGIGLAVGCLFIEAAGAGAIGFVFGLAFAYCLGKVVDMAFQAGGHQDTMGDAFKMSLTSLVDREPAGLSLNIFFPPGQYNPKTQVLYTGPAREFKVYRLYVNNCGALALSFDVPGTTQWEITDADGNATDMAQVTGTDPDGFWVQVKTAARGESVDAGNFYIHATHELAEGQTFTSTVRVIYDTNPLIFP